MKQKTSISVIIPVYNRAKLLLRAVESVLRQTLLPQEIIVVDDGSTDNIVQSIDIIKKHIQKKYLKTQIIFIRIPHCGMAGTVRNVGIKQSKGEYISFLDSDDEWMAEKTELQMQHIGNYKICHTREIWMRNGKQISQKSQKHKRNGDIFTDALHKCIIGPSTVILHKDIFHKYGLFRENLQVAEDYEFWLRITAYERVAYIEEPLVVKYDLADELQLSKMYNYIEKFRIDALQPLVEKNYFEKEKETIAKEVLSKKQVIWDRGVQKRNEKN